MSNRSNFELTNEITWLFFSRHLLLFRARMVETRGFLQQTRELFLSVTIEQIMVVCWWNFNALSRLVVNCDL